MLEYCRENALPYRRCRYQGSGSVSAEGCEGRRCNCVWMTENQIYSVDNSLIVCVGGGGGVEGVCMSTADSLLLKLFLSYIIFY